MVEQTARLLAPSVGPLRLVIHAPCKAKCQPTRPHKRFVDAQMVRLLGLVFEGFKHYMFFAKAWGVW